MRHFIITKFKKDFDYNSELENITKIFEKVKDIEGVEDVIIHTSNSTRENRSHIMIEIILTNEGLKNYDISEPHHEWKDTYGEYIESKAIFDCE